MASVLRRPKVLTRREQMSPPDCFEASFLLSPYLDGELHPDNVVRLERHLQTCDMCPRWLETLRADAPGSPPPRGHD